MQSNNSLDVLTIYGRQGRNKCGYCKSTPDGVTNYGFGCDEMDPINYFHLMNRGWRRCGTYFYNNYNDLICCPMYTIRCKTNEFELRKSQKKVLKNFRNYLLSGKKPEKPVNINARGDEVDLEKSSATIESNNNFSKQTVKDKTLKAKYKRYQLKLQKLKAYSEKIGKDNETVLKEYETRRELRRKKNQPKSLAKLLDFSDIKSPIHKFSIKTILCQPTGQAYESVIDDEHKVYVDYQMAIHKDERSKVPKVQFLRFLVEGGLRSTDSPEFITLDLNDKTTNKKLPMGQYHQQYWIDNNLIAVGVIDILPTAISSVYLFYDPKYAFLNPGVFSALYEIDFVNKMSTYYQSPQFNLYYMGFYIYNCQKMRYKGQYKGSELLCPITFNWVPVEKCEKILECIKFSQFADNDASINDEIRNKNEEEISQLIKIRIDNQIHSLNNLHCPKKLMNILIEAAKLIGLPTLNNVIISM